MQQQIGNKLKELFPEITDNLIQLQKTRPEFEGDVTLVVFPLLRITKKNPEESAKVIGGYLTKEIDFVSGFNVVKGFLNLEILSSYWLGEFQRMLADENFGQLPKTDKTYIVEYSSPNTNKPLHLGHLRNIFLGYSVANILKANGHDVVKTQIINDRGIHICKSMLAWQKFGNGETPETSGLKGDKLVGEYYVAFDKEYKKQLIKIKENTNLELRKSRENLFKNGVWKIEETDLVSAINRAYLAFLKRQDLDFNSAILDFANENKFNELRYYSNFNINEKSENGKKLIELRKEFNDINQKYDVLELSKKVLDGIDSVNEKSITEILLKEIESIVPIQIEAQEMLKKWEQGDKEVVDLWEMMNGWVYKGFDVTYNTMGVDFDTLYYESDTYLLGKGIVDEALDKKLLYTKDDDSVWCDLSDYKMSDKLLLRGDGTSVYMTQDVGTAVKRFEDYPKTVGMIYTVGNEQEHHFKVLFTILKKLGYSFADECYHLSYGMVNLPTGKMKSREGTVVDADDLMAEVINDAKEITEERGHIEGLSSEQLEKLFAQIGLGGLKYYLLKVDPRKGMMFDPAESIDLNGNTGPFIQYTFARTQSILSKEQGNPKTINTATEVEKSELDIVKHLSDLPEMIKEAGNSYSPALVANYTYELVKLYNSFYQSVSIFKEENKEKQNIRLLLTEKVAETVKFTMSLLGIEVPSKM